MCVQCHNAQQSIIARLSLGACQAVFQLLASCGKANMATTADSPYCRIRILCQIEQLWQSPALQKVLLHRRVVLHAGCYHLRCAGTNWSVLALQQAQQCLQASDVCQICIIK